MSTPDSDSCFGSQKTRSGGDASGCCCGATAVKSSQKMADPVMVKERRSGWRPRDSTQGAFTPAGESSLNRLHLPIGGGRSWPWGAAGRASPRPTQGRTSIVNHAPAMALRPAVRKCCLAWARVGPPDRILLRTAEEAKRQSLDREWVG